MVCHRCCEIALKLRRYRTNAVANDKLLKEKAGLPYTSPIVDQAELLLAARDTLCNTKSLYASLELLNVSFKKEIDASEAQLLENGTSTQPAVDSTHSGVSVGLSPNQSLTSIPPITTETSTVADDRTVLPEDDKIVNSVAISVAQNLSSKLSHVPQTLDSNAGFSKQYKGVAKVKYKHPSVRKLFDIYTNIVLPEKVFKYDISPVISLDSAEVSDWYREQLRTLEQKLPNINIKKVPNAPNSAISSFPLPSTESSDITSSKHSAGKYNIRTPSLKKRNYRCALDSSDSDKDEEEYQPFNSYQKNAISKIDLMASEVPLINLQEAIPLKDVKSNHKGANKSDGRCSYRRRKHFFLENDDTIEIIPEKKKRVYYNERTSKTPNKVDSPLCRPSTKKEQNLLSLSVESTPVQQNLAANVADTFLCRSCNKLYDTEKELSNHEKHHLRCKFCKKKMKNLLLLNKHQNETCSVNIVNNQPSIEAMKVDSIPSIVEKYAKTFPQPDVEKRTVPAVNVNSNEFIDYSELGLNMEKAESPVPSNELVVELEESIANQYFTLLEDFEKNNSNGGEKLIKENSQNSEVICLSDESDHERECISANKTVTDPSPQLDNQLHAVSTRKLQKLEMNLTKKSNLSESEIIHSMFKKHYSNAPKKCENGSQTLIGANKNITSITTTNSNTKLNNVFKDLFDYRIPVHLKSQPSVSVEFKSVSISKAPTTNFSWACKKLVDLEKRDAPKEPVADRSPKNPNVAHAGLNSPPSYYVTMANKQHSNGAYTAEKFTNAIHPAQPPRHNFNNVLKTPCSNATRTQPIAYKQSVSVPNVVVAIPSSSYQMAIAPVNRTTVAISNNQDNVFYDQPEQLFYNNQNVKVNNYFMLPNGIQQTSSLNNDIPYLNNTNSVATFEKHLQRCNFETTNPNINLVAAPTNIQLAQNPASVLRVKNIHELS